LGCSVSHSRRKEKGRAYLEDALIAGNELGEDRTAAARSVVAAKEARAREERVRDKGKLYETEGGDMNLFFFFERGRRYEPEALSGGSGGLSMSRVRASEPRLI